MIIIASYSNVSVTYTADGTQTNFSFPFDYLRKAFVFVEVNGETVLEQGTDYNVVDKTVVFQTAPVAETVLRIYRQTDTRPLVSWADASVLRAKDMTIQQVQELHILEEYQYNNVIAINIADEAKDIAEGIADIAEEALETANEAKETAEGIAGTAQEAKDTAEEALDIVQDAKDTADDAKETAEGISGIAQEAVRTAQSAVNIAQTSAVTVEEFRGDLQDFADIIKTKATWFNTIADMKRDTELTVGTVAATKGYYSINDGGGAFYSIGAKGGTDVDDGGSKIFLNNGNVAFLLIEEDKIDVKKFGAVGNGITDDTSKFANALTAAIGHTFYVPKGNYLIESSMMADGVTNVIDYGTYVNYKPVYPNKDIIFKGFPDMGLLGVITTDNGYGVQGFCYNSKTDRYLIATKLGDDSAQKILIVNPSNLSIENSVSYTALGHINTLTYVADKDEVYVVTGNNSWKAVSVLDGTTLSIKREIPDFETNGIGGLKFDPITKLFFQFRLTEDGYPYTIRDIDLNVIRTGIIDAPRSTTNGLFVYNGSAVIFNFTCIIEADFFGNVKKVINHKLREEFEDADYTPYGIIVNTNSSTPGASLYQYKENYWQPSLSMLPTSIETRDANAADLNTLVNTGNYFVSIAGTEGADPAQYHYPPAVYNGMLWVSRLSDTLANGMVRQVLFRVGDSALNTTSWQIYTRLYHSVHGAWSNWVRVDKGMEDKGDAVIDVSAQSYKDKTIYFSKTFPTTPFVYFTMFGSSTSSDYGMISPVLKDVYNNRFTIRVFNAASNGRSPGIQWWAVER